MILPEEGVWSITETSEVSKPELRIGIGLGSPALDLSSPFYRAQKHLRRLEYRAGERRARGVERKVSGECQNPVGSGILRPSDLDEGRYATNGGTEGRTTVDGGALAGRTTDIDGACVERRTASGGVVGRITADGDALTL